MMQHTDPFHAQRVAFDEINAGRWRIAAVNFTLALRGFDSILANEEMLARLCARASRNPEASGRASEVAHRFLDRLPGWLCEMHLERFNEAIWRNQNPKAILHWQSLQIAAKQPHLGNSANLANLRDKVCQRFDLTRERMTDGGEKSADGLRLAERILFADPDNNTARYRIIEGYTWQVGWALNKILPRHHSDLPDLHVTAAQKRRVEISLRRSTRRLRSHLSRAARDRDINASTAFEGYQQLSRYYVSVGDISTAIRVARRARRLSPDNRELQRWMRALRRLARSA